MASLTFYRVGKTYFDSTVAVANASIDIAEGEFVVLVGPSGCGKSTLLRVAAGLEELTSGSVLLGGVDVSRLGPRQRDIAMVFQNYALYPHMTVFENMAFGLQQRRLPKEAIARQVQEVARLLDLTRYLDRKPAQLSGGQRQRVAMGRALVREPQVFLLDEPLSNLDAKLRVQMRAALKRLHARLGVTTIYVTHDQVEAMTLGDRIAVIAEGKLQQLGAPQDVYDNPANVFVAGFIGSPPMNLLRGRTRGGQATAGDLVVPCPGVPDKDVIIGVRPECLRPAHEGMPSLAFEIVVVEPLGDEVIVHGLVGAELASVLPDEEGEAVLMARNGERAEAVARLDPRERPQAGTTIQLGVEAENVYLFDSDTGLAIR